MKTKRDILLAVILTLAMVGQIVLAFILYSEKANTAIVNLGWVILWISAVFGWLPIFTFKKYGGVPKEKSYIQTTLLVERGVYAIVRHPQYLAGILMGLALPLISQHWLVGVLGLIVILVTYFNTFDEEQLNLEKFGETYHQYMHRVPRLNFLLGIYRLLVKKR